MSLLPSFELQPHDITEVCRVNHRFGPRATELVRLSFKQDTSGWAQKIYRSHSIPTCQIKMVQDGSTWSILGKQMVVELRSPFLDPPEREEIGTAGDKRRLCSCSCKNCRASHTGDARRVSYRSVSVGVVHVLCACAQVQSTV